MLKNRKAFGFSLVELVIVMVIIGVIAAIAIPRMSRGAKGADETALVGNLAVLRNAIELYASEHGGTYPGSDGQEATFIAQLTQFSDASGATQATKDATHKFGPYIRKGIPPAPVGANKGATSVTVANTGPTVGGATGWAYNHVTGEIIVNSDAANEAGSTTYDTY